MSIFWYRHNTKSSSVSISFLLSLSFHPFFWLPDPETEEGPQEGGRTEEWKQEEVGFQWSGSEWAAEVRNVV